MDQEILRSLFHNILSIDELDGYLVPDVIPRRSVHFSIQLNMPRSWVLKPAAAPV